MHAVRRVGVGGAAHAHGPRAGAGEVIGEGAAQRRLAVVHEGDRAALGGLARRPPFDLDLGAVGLNLALVVDAKEAAGDIDADAPRAGGGRALKPLRVVEGAAGDAVHVAGDEGNAASGVAELGLDFLVGIEGGGADLEIVHGEVAEAEVENLMEDVIVARDLRVFRGAEVGKDAVRAQHQEQGLIGARAVGAAAEAVDGLDGARAGGIGQDRRGDGVDDEAAGNGDGGAGERLRPRGGEEQGRHDDGGDEHADLQDGAQRILVAAAIGQRGAQRHDLAALERGLAPRRAGDRPAVHSDGYLRPTAALLEGGYPFLLDQIGHGGADRAPTRVNARRKRTGAHHAPLGRQSMGPEIGCYELFGRPAAGLLEGDIARPSGGLIYRARRGARQGGYLHR